MPHELVNTATNTFIFRQINYVDRQVGDDVTNSQLVLSTTKLLADFSTTTA